MWLFLKKSLKGSYGPPEHFNIRFFWLNSYFYRILSIYKILKRKKKKKMDIILTDDKVLYNILMRLKSFHGVDVVFEPFPEKAKGLWNERSVYP